MSIFYKRKENGEMDVIIDATRIEELTEVQLEGLLVVTRLELDKKRGESTTFRCRHMSKEAGD